MKTIANESNSAQWDSKLLKDLSFIKKKLRYPLGTKTLTPILLIAVITILITALEITNLLHPEPGHSVNYRLIIFFSIAFIPLIVVIVRHIQSLKFVSIPTPFFLEENRQVIQDFLRAQHLAVFLHPDAPEVFQIISKTIDQYKDQREVMIFIADDKRILINSHFTSQGFTMVAAALHRKDMGNALQKWINSNTEKSKDILAV